MALVPRTREAPSLMTVCRHKFEGIFDMHGVKTGSPEAVPGFVEKLRTNRYFAMDFWGLVNSLEGLGDRITAAEIRQTVVDCVCGEWIPADDPIFLKIEQEFKGRARDMALAAAQMEKLSQQDCLAVESNAADQAPVEPEPVATPMVFELADVGAAQNESESSSLQQGSGVVELGSDFPEGSSQRMDLALSRLELNSHELKLHLDSIDSRMSRLEPHLEELVLQIVKQLGLGAAEGVRSRSGSEVAAQGQLAEPRGGDDSKTSPPIEAGVSSQLSIEEEISPPVLAEVSPPVSTEEALPTVLSAVSTDERKPWAVLRGDWRMLAGGLAAVLVVGACLVWLAVSLWAWRPQETAMRVVPLAGSTSGAVQSSAPSKPAAGTPRIGAAEDGVRRKAAREVRSAPADADTDTGVEVGEDGTAPPSTRWYDGSHKPSGAPGNAGGTALAEASRVATGGAMSGAGTGERGSRGDATGRGAGPARVALSRSVMAESAPATESVESGMRQVRVSSGVMASNLVESSTPDYPKLARLTGMQGPVVMDVVISDRGTVDRIDVVKGHRLLRGAAESAVKRWRYRPYLLDGRPVEVATTVTVDFKLEPAGTKSSELELKH
jgi:TonB family protein